MTPAYDTAVLTVPGLGELKTDTTCALIAKHMVLDAAHQLRRAGHLSRSDRLTGVGVIEAASAPSRSPEQLHAFANIATQIESLVSEVLSQEKSHMVAVSVIVDRLRTQGLTVTAGPRSDSLYFVSAGRLNDSAPENYPHYSQLNVDLTLDEVANGGLERTLVQEADQALAAIKKRSLRGPAERLVNEQRMIIDRARQAAEKLVQRARQKEGRLFWAGVVPGVGAGFKAGRKLTGYLTITGLIAATETAELGHGGTAKNQYLLLPKNPLSSIWTHLLTRRDRKLLQHLAGTTGPADLIHALGLTGSKPMRFVEDSPRSLPTVDHFVASAFAPESETPDCDRYPVLDKPLPADPYRHLVVFEARRLPRYSLAELSRVAARLRFDESHND
jgi:hypothetical protein